MGMSDPTPSTLFITRVLTHQGHNATAEDDIRPELEKITELYRENKRCMDFQTAALMAKSTWLQAHLLDAQTKNKQVVDANDLHPLISTWNHRAASFRALAGEYDLSKHEHGISKEMKKHRERAEKHLDACCRMVEDCAKELRAVINKESK
jgi:hypothetical protein